MAPSPTASAPQACSVLVQMLVFIPYGDYGDILPGRATMCSVLTLTFGNRLSLNGVEHSGHLNGLFFSEIGDFIKDDTPFGDQLVYEMNEHTPEDDFATHEHGHTLTSSKYVLSQFGSFSEKDTVFGGDYYVDLRGFVLYAAGQLHINQHHSFKPCEMDDLAECDGYTATRVFAALSRHSAEDADYAISGWNDVLHQSEEDMRTCFPTEVMSNLLLSFPLYLPPTRAMYHAAP